MLEKVIFNNFKGIEHMEFDLKKTNLFAGTNGAFKTTFKDGIIWCPTGCDHKGNTDYEIKTRKGNEILHGLDHSVELHFTKFKIRRVYRESWIRKRGTSEKVFEKHETEGWIDLNDGEGFILCKKISDFKKFVDLNLGGKDFIQYVDPEFFSSNVHWKDRRKVISDICGGVDQDEIIQRTERKFPDIKEIVQNGRAEDLHAKYDKISRDADKELATLEKVIEEAEENRPYVGDLTKEDADKAVADLEKKIETQEIKLRDIDINNDIRKKLISAEDKKLKKIRKFADDEDVRKKLEKEQHEKKESEITKKRQDAKDLLDNANEKKTDAERNIKSTELALSINRENFQAIQEKTFQHDEKCPTCSKKYKADEIEEFETNFKTNKAKALKAINADVKIQMQTLHDDKNRIKSLNIGKLEKDFEEAHKAYADFPEYVFKPTKLDTSKETEKINDLKQQLKDASSTIEERKAPIREKIEALKEEKKKADETVAKFPQIDAVNKRIADHIKNQQKLSKEYNDAVYKVDALSCYINHKYKMLEKKVFDKIGVNFRFFINQLNNGITECCDTLVKNERGDLIPWESANKAGRVDAGIKICKNIKESKGIDAPIIIDNAESIVKIADTDEQIIQLVVDADYKIITQL